MTLRAIALLLALSTCTLAAQTTPSLDSQLQAIAAAHHGKVALFAENLATHQSAALNPDTVVQTASVIKLAVLYEALEQVRAGQVAFTDKITLNKPEQVPGSGILRLLDAPLQLTFKDVLTLMIILSDNTSTNLAIDHLGLANINDRIASLGLKNTYLYKKVFTPVAPGTILPADQKRFGLGKTTPREMSELLTKIIRCELATPGAPAHAGDAALCKVAIDMLHLQFYRTSIPRYLDGLPGATGDSIANKTGSLDAVRNDVAAISSKHGMIVISAFTYDNADHSWGADHEAELTIAKLARAIVSEWSPDGLSAWPATILPTSK